MPRPRLILAGLLAILVALALAVPALSLAGGSAGDQQYTDPFGSSSASATSTAPATPTQTTPAPSTTPATSAPASTGTLTTDPTATAATSTSTATLPYTGYDLWTGVGFGVAMVAGGIVLRRRARRA